MSEAKDLKAFIQHGVIFDGRSGEQAYGTAPFANKFYINVNTHLWDSKVSPVSGNFQGFLENMFKFYRKNITSKDFKKLSDHRGIPESELRLAEIGKSNNGSFVIPIKDEKGNIQNLKLYEFGKPLIGTAGCNSYLWGAEKIRKHKDRSPVYICEGEWDGMAMDWLLRANKKPGITVAVPGATTWKDEWVHLLYGKDCIVLMDKDDAGDKGEEKAIEKLEGKISSIKFIKWLDKFPSGFDIRDFVKMEAVKNKRPKRCFERLCQMITDTPRNTKGKTIEIQDPEKPKLEVDKKMTWNRLVQGVKKWMKVEDFDPLKVAVGVLLSNFIEGEPVWLFLVACPGVGKSEILGMFKHCPQTYTTSSITPNALISGAVAYKGKEPSLLPKLNGKMLCIKDFSTIQTMRDNDRDALLGILRDAYDGSAGKDFGTGEHKWFESKFSILAGVTPSIYELEHQFSSLGERFLKIFIGEYLDHEGQLDVIEKAMNNVGKEDKMRDEFAHAMFSFIENTKEYILSDKYKKPTLRIATERKIINLAAWCSRMKGTVSRDRWEKDVITNKAYSEIGTRTGKQLKRLILTFPTVIYGGIDTEEDYQVLKRVTLDSVSAKREDIFRAVFVSCETKEDTVDIKQIIHITKYDYSTALRSLDDLIALKAIERIGHRKPYQYRVTEKMEDYTRKSELYSSGRKKK